MKKILILSLLSVIWFVSPAQTDAGRLINEGIALHDKGDLEAAVAKYNAAIQLEPDNYQAQYEKSLSLMSLKKYDEAEEILKKILKDARDPEYRQLAYINYGNIMDYRGEGKKSLKLYDQGIKEFPNGYLLYFNKGVTQAGMGESEDAAETFKLALQRNPYHASSHNGLGRMVSGGNRIAGMLSMFSFLLIESKGKRAEENRVLLNKLLMKGVSRTDSGHVHQYRYVHARQEK
jgi:tetratricopeptide (TPR) repeat protein